MESAQNREAPFSLAPGSRAPVLRNVDYTAHDRFLILFLSTTCHYCVSRIPFYNRLQYIARESHAARALYAIFSEPSEAVEAFKIGSRLDIDSLVSLDFRSLGVRSTPTTLLIDKEGIVKRFWIGASENIESEILSHFQAKPGD